MHNIITQNPPTALFLRNVFAFPIPINVDSMFLYLDYIIGWSFWCFEKTNYCQILRTVYIARNNFKCLLITDEACLHKYTTPGGLWAMHGIKMNVYLISRQNCLLICPSVRLADNILTLLTFTVLIWFTTTPSFLIDYLEHTHKSQEVFWERGPRPISF